MDSIIHFEKQQGMLCAQHALNALLQGSYFSVMDLAAIANQIDQEEHGVMAESGTESAEFLSFMRDDSHNMDDSGFFSVQVISRALEVWSLSLVPYLSTDQIARNAQTDPTSMSAYICNYRQHWFTIRKIGHQWFNLNSMLPGPELISETYLHLFLAQLREEQYSIFIVVGTLPHCDADDVLKLQPWDSSHAAVTFNRNALLAADSIDNNDPELRAAINASKVAMEFDDASLQQALRTTQEAQLEADTRQAIEASLLDNQGTVFFGKQTPPSAKSSKTKESSAAAAQQQPTDSGATSTFTSTTSSAQDRPAPNADEVRQRRAAFLDRVSKNQ